MVWCRQQSPGWFDGPTETASGGLLLLTVCSADSARQGHACADSNGPTTAAVCQPDRNMGLRFMAVVEHIREGTYYAALGKHKIFCARGLRVAV